MKTSWLHELTIHVVYTCTMDSQWTYQIVRIDTKVRRLKQIIHTSKRNRQYDGRKKTDTQTSIGREKTMRKPNDWAVHTTRKTGRLNQVLWNDKQFLFNQWNPYLIILLLYTYTYSILIIEYMFIAKLYYYKIGLGLKATICVIGREYNVKLLLPVQMLQIHFTTVQQQLFQFTFEQLYSDLSRHINKLI